MKDDTLRGRVCAFVATVLNDFGELDEALMLGTRALEIAERFGDSSLRILATGFLVETHYYRGEYERAVHLATENLAALPPDLADDYAAMPVPPLAWTAAS